MDRISDEAAARRRAHIVTALCITFLVLTWVTAGLRTWVRTVTIKNFGWDDAVMLVSMVSFTLYCSFLILLATLGFGDPNFVVASTEVLGKAASYLLATFALYASTMVLLKISLGIFYLRIVVDKWQKWTVYATLTVVTGFGIFYFFSALFQCGKPSKFIENAYNGRCRGSNETLFAVNMTAGMINAVSDIVLAILPITTVRKAQMNWRAKASVSVVLLIGCSGCAVSVARLFFIHDLSYSENIFEDGITISMLSLAEAGICITAACMATLRPMFRCLIEGGRRTLTPGGFQSWLRDNSRQNGTHGSGARHSPAGWHQIPKDARLGHGDIDTAAMADDRGAWPLQDFKHTRTELDKKGFSATDSGSSGGTDYMRWPVDLEKSHPNYTHFEDSASAYGTESNGLQSIGQDDRSTSQNTRPRQSYARSTSNHGTPLAWTGLQSGSHVHPLDFNRTTGRWRSPGPD